MIVIAGIEDEFYGASIAFRREFECHSATSRERFVSEVVARRVDPRRCIQFKSTIGQLKTMAAKVGQ